MLTLVDPMDCSLPGSSVHGIFQARILEWVAIFFSSGSSKPRDETQSPALQADFLPTELPQRWFWDLEYIGVFLLSISFCILNCYNENVLFL